MATMTILPFILSVLAAIPVTVKFKESQNEVKKEQ
jgi:hypothetical protein